MKSKKVLTILLALAIMVTFMPTMAFADTTNVFTPDKVTWSEDYSKATVTVTGNETVSGVYNTVRTYEDGLIYVAISTTGKDWTFTGDKVSTAYYDLSVATFATSASTELKAEYLNGNYVTPNYVKLNVPSYVANETKPAAVYKAIADINNGYETLTVAESKNGAAYDVKYDSTEDQKFDVVMTATYSSTTEQIGASIYGLVGTASVLVHKRALVPSDAKFYFDAVNEDFVWTQSNLAEKTMRIMYDGDTHKVVADEIPGYTLTYTVFNSSTGKWDEVKAIEITNVNVDANGNEKDIQARATYSKANATPVVIDFRVNLLPCVAPIFGFDEDLSTDDYDCVYKVSGTEYNALDYVKVSPFLVEKNKEHTETTVERTNRIAFNAASKKAVAANQSALMNLFNDVCEIKAKVSKSNANNVALTIEPKDLSQKDLTELYKKHGAVIANFTFNDGLDKSEGNLTATVKLNADAIDDNEVTFTKAIAAKTYKGKKLIKNGKLKKDQTIQFTAEAANGKKVIYKLIDANTSKITIDSATGMLTLKKGLAKGTYKFKVKAYIPGENVWAYEIQNVKIKVNKK